MRLVKWRDSQGRNRRSLVRANDPDSLAPRGIPQDPPDLDLLDWDAIKRDLFNALQARGLRTIEDVEAQSNGLTGALRSVFNRRLLALYRGIVLG